MNALVAVNRSQNEVNFNVDIGSGKPVSVNEIISILGYTKTQNIPKRPGEPEITHADIKNKEHDWLGAQS